MSVRAWEPDPTGRHQYRWWDGEKWTDQVANNGVQTTDPINISETLSPPHTPQAASPPVTTDTSTVGPTGKKIRPAYVASPWARLGARIVDALIFFPPVFIILFLFGSDDIGEESYLIGRDDIDLALITFAALCVYEVVMTATKGQTLGKMVTGIKVVRSTNHALPSWGQSTGRWALPYAVGIIPIFFLGLFTLLCNLSLLWGGPLRRGWHDKAAKTVVIKAR